MGLRAARALLALSVMLVIVAVVVRTATAQTFTVLHEFGGVDGANPLAPLVQDAAGNLYGTTAGGGSSNFGAVFKVDKTDAESVLLSFDITNGSFPASGLLLDKAGNLYSTALGGPGGSGVAYRLSKTGKEKILYAFQGGKGSKAAVPSGNVLMDKAGNMYGAAMRGGLGVGVLYKISPRGKLTVLYTFKDKSDGGVPQGPLVQDADGNLYGTALDNGNQLNGNVFKLDKNRKLTVLHTFTGGSDGSVPYGGLLMDSAGNLYGNAFTGGDSGQGTVFEITKKGTFKRLYSFTGGEDGANPIGQLVQDAKGNLYGTASVGGAFVFYGTVFKLDRTGRLTVLHAFTGGKDGANPFAGVIRDSTGTLYGTAEQNFLFNQRDGNVFKVTP
jgi:uncharacterized repeat protein (TIGR03803 family)